MLQDNGGDDLSLTANGSFAFATKLAGGAAYNVTVKTNPSGQTCSVANGTGTIAAADVTNVAVSCTAHRLRGQRRLQSCERVAGCRLDSGQRRGALDRLAGGRRHERDRRRHPDRGDVQQRPVLPDRAHLDAALGRPVGWPAVRAQNGGQNTYLGIYFWNSGSPQLRLYKRIAGTWTQLGSSYNSGPLPAGTTLQLSATGSTISFLQDGVTRITATDTSISGGAPGIMTYGQAKADNWAGAGAGGSAPTYSVGGSTSGLSGTVVLRDNGGDDLTLTANGSFAFATKLASGAAYNVTVKTNPSGQTCSVANGTGTIAAADVTNVAVSCASSPTYSVGGSTSGLSGTVVLRDNGGDDLTLTANGSFAFATKLAGGAAYNVTVKTNPSGQTCSVANGSGTIAAADVTNVAVSCTAHRLRGQRRLQSCERVAGCKLDSGQRRGALDLLAGGRRHERDRGRHPDRGDVQQRPVVADRAHLDAALGRPVGRPSVRTQNGGQNTYLGIYFWNSGSPQLRLYKRITGTWTQLGSSYNSGPLPAGTTLQLSATGSTISFLQDGVTRITATDASISGGVPGIMTLRPGQSRQLGRHRRDHQHRQQRIQRHLPEHGRERRRVVRRQLRRQRLRHADAESASAHAPGRGRASQLPLCAAGRGRAWDGLRRRDRHARGARRPEPVQPDDHRAVVRDQAVVRRQPGRLEPPLRDVHDERPRAVGDAEPLDDRPRAELADRVLEVGHWRTGSASQASRRLHARGVVGLPRRHVELRPVRGLAANYGTDANFQANYRLTPIFLEAHKLPFISNNRIWIGGYQGFETDISDYDALLNSVGIAHTTGTPTLMPHRWDSGWVQIALAALSQDSQNLTIPVTRAPRRGRASTTSICESRLRNR